MDKLPFYFEFREFWEFFCPICKAERRSFYWPAPRKKHYISLAVLAGLITFGCWSWFGVKGAFLILPIWAVFEFYYRAKARQSLICPHCGFDPYLYKFDVTLARKKVEQFFANKKTLLEEKKKANQKIEDQKDENKK